MDEYLKMQNIRKRPKSNHHPIPKYECLIILTLNAKSVIAVNLTPTFESL